MSYKAVLCSGPSLGGTHLRAIARCAKVKGGLLNLELQRSFASKQMLFRSVRGDSLGLLFVIVFAVSVE